MTSFKEQPFAQLTYLQWLSMKVNRLTELEGLIGPSLESLILTGWSVRFYFRRGCDFNEVMILERDQSKNQDTMI